MITTTLDTWHIYRTWTTMSEQLRSGDILCFYEVKNPEGNTAGMMVKESQERTIDNYVQWAKKQQITLPPGHIFHRALWVRLTGSRPETPFIPTEVPFTVDNNGSVSFGKHKFWLNHIFTLYADIDAPAEEE
mgnify:FL=1|jgi:hypothetical protein